MFSLERNIDSNQCRIIYNTMSDIIKPLMERIYKRSINCTLIAMDDKEKDFSYTLLFSRTIVLNTAPRTFKFGGDVERYLRFHENNPNILNMILLTTMLDDVVHELHHLIIPTESRRYSSDSSYAMIIENTVKLNTFAFLKEHYWEISHALGYEYDMTFLELIKDQFRHNAVEPTIGYRIVRPFC